MSPSPDPHRYAPDRDVLPNGVIVEEYGRAHAARQADADELLDGIAWADSAIALKVHCRCSRHSLLATVYRTVPPVIRIDPETHRDADLRRVQRQLAPAPLQRDTRIHYGRDKFLDILTAPDDRDLYARCVKCGRHELDRDAVLDAYESGASDMRTGAGEGQTA